MRTLAIIPAFNEEECLANTVRNLVATCPDVDYLVINDGSTDATAQICDELALPHIDLPINTGLSSGFQAGMKYAQRNGYEAAVQFDADGQHLPQYISAMAQAMVDHDASVVVASRVLAGQSATGARNIGSKLISALIFATTGTRITDPTSGMRMYNRALIEEFAVAFDLGPEPDTLAMLARRGETIVEIPARMEERQGGRSYLDLPHVVRYMARTCLSILMFQWFR